MSGVRGSPAEGSSDATQIGVAIIDARFRLLFATQGWYRLSGTTPSAGPSEGWLGQFSAKTREALLQAFTLASKSGTRRPMNVCLERPGATPRDCAGEVTPILIATEQILVAIFEDVTTTLRSSNGADVSLHQYRLMFDNMQNGFALHRVIVDEQGTPVDYEFLAMNASYSAMTGLHPETAIGRRVTELLPGTERDPERWIEVFGDVALTGRTIRKEAFSEAIGKWFEVVAYRPAPLQFAVLIHEITERKQLEWALIEVASRERRRLGQELHDGLGQELTGISLIAEALARSETRTDPHDRTELLRLAGLARHAIETCRGVAHGLSPLEEYGQNLDSALRALVERHAQLRSPSVGYESSGFDGDTLQPAVAEQLLRIAQEALTNAIRHAEARLVVVRLKATRTKIQLEIQDDGHGLRMAEGDGGIGLKTMRYRASVIGADFSVGPGSTGGTVVSCIVRRATARGAAA